MVKTCFLVPIPFPIPIAVTIKSISFPLVSPSYFPSFSLSLAPLLPLPLPIPYLPTLHSRTPPSLSTPLHKKLKKAHVPLLLPLIPLAYPISFPIPSNHSFPFPPLSSFPYSLLFRKSWIKVSNSAPLIFPFPFTLQFLFYPLLPSCSLSGGEEEGVENREWEEEGEMGGDGTGMVRGIGIRMGARSGFRPLFLLFISVVFPNPIRILSSLWQRICRFAII